MPFLIGTDEAGYGPNLGPLVVSATVWRVAEDRLRADLYQQLDPFVASTPQTDTVEGRPRVVIADSKQLYSAGGGLGRLETGVLAAVKLLGHSVNTWQDLWDAVAGNSGAHRQDLPWYEHVDMQLPLDADIHRILEAESVLATGITERNVSLTAVRSAAVFPKQFNELVDQLGSKGELLTRITLELLGDVMDELPDEPVLVICDKHGGRNRYAAQLQAHFPDYLIEVHGESRPQSTYRWGPHQQRTEIRFQSKGESFLPAALASMTSKYLRELAMKAFNDFWRRRRPLQELKPTAGYPVDARRFRKEIDAELAKLQIEDDVIWRRR